MYLNKRKGKGMKNRKEKMLIIFAGLLILNVFLTGCRNEEDDVEKISSIEIEESNISLRINDVVHVKVTAKSDEAKRNEVIRYSAVENGIVDILQPSNDGVVIKGVKKGNTVITAKSQYAEASFRVEVKNEDALARYITVEKPVIELKEGNRVSTQVSLYGGNAATDNPRFVWNLEEKKNNIGISTTGNVVVIAGLERGHQRIRVSHPNAEFDNEILVFVRGVDEEIKYLTSTTNVFLVPNDGQYHDFDMVLINGVSSDVIDIKYNIEEGGGDVIEISGSQTKCNVLAKKSGTTVVKVSHPQAAAVFDMRVIVYDIDVPYIALDKTFVLLNVAEIVRVEAKVEYARNGVLHKAQFQYEIYENNVKVPEETSIISIDQTQENFWISGRRGGTARIVISNEQTEIPREILVVVQEEAIFIDDYYFTTTQNVITTQVGDNPVFLRVQLINGTSAEANRFVWEIDDGTVADIYAHHGVARVQRAMIKAFEGVLEITPKKPGTARIRITNEHEKYAMCSVSVIVKVYPAGTFVHPSVQVGYSGLIKVEFGKPETILLNKIPENLTNDEIGSLDWSIDDPGIAALYTSAHSVTNIVSAVKSTGGGITKMRVQKSATGGKIEFPHESIVIAGDNDYLANTSVIYVDSVYQKVTEQQQVMIPVLNSKYEPQNAELWYPEQFTVWVEKPENLYAVMVKNRLILQGKMRGETEVIVRHPNAVNESITLHVRVEPMNISIDQPYYFRVPEIIGVVRGFPVTIGDAVRVDENISTGDLRVEMVGAPESETAKILWSSENSSAVSVMGSGSSAVITGNTVNTQTKIWVRHKDNKAEERFILVYVAANKEDLKKIVISSGKENYLLTTGQRQLITVITNADDEKKKYIDWEIVKRPGDPDIITIDKHYDSAMVEAVAAGNAELRVWYENPNGDTSLVPLTIYISVVDALSGDKVIKGPPIIGIAMGESKFVSVEHINMTQTDLNRISWEVIVSDGGGLLANIEGNGDSAYLYGLRRGVGKVKITQSLMNYEHYATLVCAETVAEMESMYVMGVDQSYHQMQVGEEKKIKLVFGNNGFSETAKKNLKWTAGSSGSVRVAGSGESVSIVAVEPGECTVTVSDENNPQVSFNKTVELKFLVRGIGESTLEFRGHQKMLGIVVGEKADPKVELHLFDGSEEIKNYALWEHENENNAVVKVSRADNILDIEAKSVGETYITVIYNQGQKDETKAKILVYTARDEDALRAYYPVLIEKTNYLLQIGQTAVVKIETMEEKDHEHFKYISWGIENADVIESVEFNGKKQENIRGRSEGQCVLTVNYNNGTDINKIVGRIFITVVGNDVIDLTKYIVTDNIIGMVVGDNRSSKIFHNLGSNVSNVVWTSLDTSKVVVSGTGEEAVLTAIGSGETYVTVSYGSWLKRYILVYVCGSQPEVSAYKAMNMECQYYRAGTGETIVLPIYFAPNKSTVPTLWTDKYENKVVRFASQENGAKMEIETLNEGVAVLEAVNTGLSNPSGVLRIYIEVSKKYNGAERPVVNRYLTIQKTVYVMNPDNRDEELNLHVSGVGYTVNELKGVVWAKTKGHELIDIFPNGQDCAVRVNLSGIEGTAELKASLLDNDVGIKIVVSKTGLMGFPHIVGQDTIRLGLGGKANIGYDIAEIDQYDKGRFHVEIMSGWNVVGENTRFEDNILKVEGAESGTAVLRITCVPVCNAAHYKEVLVIVTTTADGLIYLTTRDNFTLVKIDEVKTISLDMIGFNNAGDAGYTWDIQEEDREYLELSATGRQAQVKGKKEGSGKTVMITVSNTYVDPMFNLTLFVRISSNYLDVVYLTTRNNIVTVTQGKSVYVEAELVGGAPGEDSQLLWSSENAEFADAQGRGKTGVVFGCKEGLARIKVSYPLAINKVLEILVIVERDNTADGIYITSPNMMVELKPGDTREISASLVGNGVGVGDEFGFTWKVHTGQDVVEIYGAPSGTDKVFIRGLKEGEATIRVEHLFKTKYVLDLKIYVQYYNKVEFGTKSVSLDNGKFEIVNVTMPPNTTVVYSAGKYKKPDGTYIDVVQLSPEITNSSGYLIITGIAPGVCTITATGRKENGLMMTDQMIVTVRAVENKLLQYIVTNDSIFNMTDWRSAANRVMVSGSTVGEKLNGDEFTEADDLNIQWTIESGDEYIEFDNGGKSTRGKQVSIFSKMPGTATVKLTHDDMKVTGYEKRIYVNVRNYDGNFLLNPTFTSMQIDDQAAYSVTITGNVTDDEYDLVSWRVGKNEKDEIGIELIDGKVVNVNDKYKQEGIIGEKAAIIARKSGVYKIYAEYKGKIIEGIIYVEPKKVLEIYDDSVVRIVPGYLRFIGLYHEPFIGQVNDSNGAVNPDLGLGMRIDYNIDSSRYIDVVYAGPILDADFKTERPDFLPRRGESKNPYNNEITVYEVRNEWVNNKTKREEITKKGYNALLVVRGKDDEGYTKIKLKYKNIERVVTVHNSTADTFYMEGTIENGKLIEGREVRGKPSSKIENKRITIKYNIYPKSQPVVNSYDLGNGKHNNGCLVINDKEKPMLLDNTVRVVDDIVIDHINQTVSFRLNHCGYTVLVFENELYEGYGHKLEIPVYVYYEKMDVNWGMESVAYMGGSNKKLSRLDSITNVLYLVNDEMIYIYFKNKDAYYGEDLEIISAQMGSSSDARVIKGANNIAHLGPDIDVIGESKMFPISNPESRNDVYDARYWIEKDGNEKIRYVYIKGNETVDNTNVSGNSLLDVKYLEELRIEYKYSDGKRAKGIYNKSFLVYKEKRVSK
jgi:hypothetical protein